MILQYDTMGGSYLKGDRLPGRISDMSCSIVGRRFREEEQGEERTGRRKERRSSTVSRRRGGKQKAIAAPHTRSTPAATADGAPATASLPHPPRNTSSASPRPPTALPLSPAAILFFAGDAPHTPSLSSRARLRLALSSTTPSPLRLPGGRSGIAGAVSVESVCWWPRRELILEDNGV
jgi:hypothetical protein